MRTPGIIQPIDAGFEEVMSSLVGAPKLPNTARSPLRYPGGKSRAVDTIRDYIPEDTKEIVSPFLGGGSVELACAADGIKVHGADAFEPLVNFWRQAKEQPVLLSERVRDYHPLTKPKFYNLQKSFHRLTDELDRAVVFFVLNRCSFSGTTLCGGMSPDHPRFTPSAIDRLRDFRTDMEIECADYKETIEAHEGLLYLDPPYANGEKLYGRKGDMHDFNHKELADILKHRNNWILSYNESPLIRELYKDYEIFQPEWSYGMSRKGSEEILVVNL